MTLAEFKTFVASHQVKFDGAQPIAAHEFDEYERRLGHPLPQSLRWLLGTQGYSNCSGVDNLDEAVERTLTCRTSILLPRNWLLLNDWGEAGMVLLDLPTGRVCWCGSHNAGNLASGQIDADAEWFDGYAEWAASRVANL